jgi:hypothetical protein
MLLSEAIRLGSLLVHPEAANIEGCAIAMALKAIGAWPENLDDCRCYRGGQWNQWNTLAYPERTLRDAYPWLEEEFPCPWCGERLRGEAIVAHPFDRHVMGRRIPLEALCDWIATIEPESRVLSQGLATRWGPVLPNAA